MTDSRTLLLRDDGVVPAVGFGTYKLDGMEGAETIAAALRAGYRLLDTAFNYENEGAVGQGVRRSGIARDELLVASKLPGRHHRYAEALRTIEESVFRTGLDHLDLYLIHWPNPKQGHYVEAWQALIESRDCGLVRHIGVCNFLPEHLDRLAAETGEMPAINQIELHPFFPQDAQRAADRERGIVTQAWSPLGRAGDVLHNPALRKIAERIGRSIPQVILRWHLQLGVMPLPKATSADRQRENLALFDFELSDQDMQSIRSLARPDGRIADQDPSRYEEF